MSQFTICGDPHAQPGNLEKIGKLFDIFEDIGNPVIILGDLFDTKEILRARVFNFVHKRLAGSKLHFTILVGNHDWFNLDCEEHSLETLKLLPNVTIIDKPTHLGDMLFMPYFDDLEAFREALTGIPGFKKPQTLFMHQGIIGFDYGNGYIADGNGHGELPEETFKGFKRLISGHFHKHEGPFLGTPFSHTFGETDQAKYIAIWDSETDEMELFETPFPRHITLDFKLNDDPTTNHKLLSGVSQGENLYRVRLIGTEMQIKAIDQSLFPNVKFLEEPTDSEQVEDVKLKDTDSNEQKFLVWAKELKKLNDDVVKLGLEILTEAR